MRTERAGVEKTRHGTADLQIRLPFDVPVIEPAEQERPASGSGKARRANDGPLRVAPPDTAAPTAAAPEVHFVRHPRARRYVLRVQPDGSVRVTIPRRGSRREGEAFLQRSRHWVDRQRARLATSPGRRALANGDTVLLAGVPTPLVVDVGGGGVTIQLGEIRHRARTTSDARAVVVAALRNEAQRQLPARLLELAQQAGLSAGRVTIRDQKGRWGSCAASGNISLNWRLVQMPPEVRDYVLLHELMHLREQNHSRRFWKHVADACPWHLQARRWLAREGRGLL